MGTNQINLSINYESKDLKVLVEPFGSNSTAEQFTVLLYPEPGSDETIFLGVLKFEKKQWKSSIPVDQELLDTVGKAIVKYQQTKK